MKSILDMSSLTVFCKHLIGYNYIYAYLHSRELNTQKIFQFILIIFALNISFLILNQTNAIAFESNAKQVILVDDLTGTVLFSKNHNEKMHPASMSKLMTLYVVFDLIKEGKINLDDNILVSERAWRMRGSRMFLEVGKKVSIEDLLRGVIVHSGNDACVVLAEGIAGSESGFADLMNQKAQEFGMTSSKFINATGWPNAEHLTTAKDLAILIHKIIHDFPEYYPIFSELKFKHNKISQPNRNPLLKTYPGADGLKTGYTEAAGYGLAASAIRSDRRLILVANGISSSRKRAKETARILDYGFSHFKNYELFQPGEIIEEIDVWLGEKPSVSLMVEDNITLTLSREVRKGLKVSVHAPGPIQAPVTKGEVIAYLNVEVPNRQLMKIPLLAAYSVDSLSGFGRIGAAFRQLLWGEHN